MKTPTDSEVKDFFSTLGRPPKGRAAEVKKALKRIKELNEKLQKK